MATNPADVSLLATKLFVPPPRPNRVNRTRLRDQLDAAAGGIVTLAAAPAGSGKSTLLAEWARSAECRVAWLSLDPPDDEPCRFLNYVIAALKNAGALASDDLFGTVTSPGAIEAVLTELLNAIAARGARIALVLDDYHVIESQCVHMIVQSVIDHLPPNLQLVIASRIDPPLTLSRLRARGMLVEIRAADLRFTLDEAARFLNEAMDLRLNDEQVAELERRTEGWAVGLQMAAISLRGREGAEPFIASFSGSNRYVLDYLTDEVLLGQPEEVRSFLLQTSILTQLSAPLCDAVTGRLDSSRMLHLLDSANLFLIPLDDVRFWYRYHHLFGSLLEHELTRTTSADTVADLHRRAASWYASSGMPEHALHHAVAAHDDDRAIAIVLEHAPMRIIAGDGGTVVRWIAQLPRQRVDDDIELLILYTRALTCEYDVDAGMRAILRAEEILPAENRTRYEGIILSLRGMLERMKGDPVRSVEMLERAMTHFTPDDFWYSMTALHLGMVALMGTDLRNAERYLQEATASRDRPDGLLTAVFARTHQGWVSLWRGHPDEAARMANEANEWIDAWDAQRGMGRPLGSLAFALLADVHRMKNDLPRAREFARRAVDLAKQGFLMGFADAARALAEIELAEGDFDAALAVGEEMIRAIRCAGNADWVESARTLLFHIRWRRAQLTGNHEDLEIVTRWCEESGLLHLDEWRKHLEGGDCPDYPLMIAARLLLHQQRCDEAQKLVAALLEEAERTERVPSQISLLILRSLLEVLLDRPDSAVDTMQSALAIGSRAGFVRFFLDEGSQALPLIERAAARTSDRDFALRLLSAFEVPVKLRSAVAGEPENLSEREIEVLRLVAAGASNQAAARKLFVAPSTVKKHLENIYTKLGVGGRTQAVARARELQIL